MNTPYEKVIAWYEQFAPGLNPMPIPENAEIEGPLEPLVPYGLQYRVKIGDAIYPRHQAGPGVSIVVTDTERIALKPEYREETKQEIVRICGGFATENIEAARSIVTIYQAFDMAQRVPATAAEHPQLFALMQQLMSRDFEWSKPVEDCIFMGRVMGYSNVTMCGILGAVVLTKEEFDATSLPVVMNIEDALSFTSFSDHNTRKSIHLVKALSQELKAKQ